MAHTQLLPIQVKVAPSSAGGNQESMDIVGFAANRAASLSSNTVAASAITPVIEDRTDSRLRRGQVARPSPWTNVD
jgi:hypothetical protein